jgi:AraC family transcriptional activator of pobA
LAVIEQRLANEARRHLLFSTLSIKQIGAELGYDDPGYFSRFITRMFGLPPARLRERMRQR